MTTILLIGAYGFLGSNILNYINRTLPGEYKVIAFDKFPYHPHGMRFDCVSKSYAGDFSDSYLMNEVFEQNKIDLVIHSLSTTIPARSYNAKYDIESNLIPSINLLDTMLKYNVKDIVYISSGGAIYGDFNKGLHKENEDVFPKSSYGVIKLSIEKYMMQYAELYGLRPLIVRLSNPYGPYHYSMKQGICNVALATAINNDIFKVWGNGEGRKDYIYVEDFVTILFKLLNLKIHTQVINIGSNKIVSVNGILKEIKCLVPDFKWEYAEASRYDVSDFELDTSKLESLIGKYEFKDITDGMKLTYDWTKSIC
ncbi:MAG: NAD-dependent epimerase/dehydratase family protein [Bacteroidales bacterium]|nr:NAD-dependent epimerase/dehydratase family protein [archaeon]MCQ2307202.1 NAD-dependent epimerase/dehydratase family protein [Bacteroidales bacterium]